MRPAAPKTDVPESLENQTIEMIVHTTIGGTKVRVEISNSFGNKPLVIGAVSSTSLPQLRYPLSFRLLRDSEMNLSCTRLDTAKCLRPDRHGPHQQAALVL